MQSTSSPSLLPPECLQTDDYTAADAARQRLISKPRFPFFKSTPNLRAAAFKAKLKGGDLRGKKKEDDLDEQDDRQTVDIDINPLRSLENIQAVQEDFADNIILDDNVIPGGLEGKDIYRWAMLYENQRGATIFSIPYYSSLSLLPTDPLPFTLPSASPRRRDQPSLSFSTYPLPDGKWRWVSKSWMIDMRSDSGEVQYDGFEYNWRFRREKWRAEVGNLSAGGWVRRRRWVRLMVRPAQTRKTVMDEQGEAVSGSSTPAVENGSIRASIPPLVIYPGSPLADSYFDSQAEDVWRGDDPEDDWKRCHSLMKRLGRDGRKLELWTKWLAVNVPQDGKGKQWTEDNEPLPSEVAKQNRMSASGIRPPSLEHIIAVIRKHGDSILRTFVYPDSRAQFLELLGHAGLLPELNIGLGIGWSASEVDFWSYASGIDRVGEKEIKGKEKITLFLNKVTHS